MRTENINCNRVWKDRHKYRHHIEDVFTSGWTTCDLTWPQNGDHLFRWTSDVTVTDCPRCRAILEDEDRWFWCAEAGCDYSVGLRDHRDLHAYSH